MSYNGWTNYETWNVALWCDNEYDCYQARVAIQKQSDWNEVSTRNFINSWYPLGITPDIKGLMDAGADTAPVNYQEIADAWNEGE